MEVRHHAGRVKLNMTDPFRLKTYGTALTRPAGLGSQVILSSGSGTSPR